MFRISAVSLVFLLSSYHAAAFSAGAPPSVGRGVGLRLRSAEPRVINLSRPASANQLRMVQVPVKPSVVDLSSNDDEILAQHGNSVQVAYTVVHPDGTIIESSGSKGIAGVMGQKRKIPARIIKEEFCLGEDSEVHPRVQNAILGLGLGRSTSVRIPAGAAFGHKHDDLIYTVTKDMVGVPADMPVPLNTVYKINGGKDARVVEEDGKYLVLDSNHELAGEDLVLHISLQNILGENCNIAVEECMFQNDA